MKNQIKSGVAISYLNIVLNMCISIFFTPFLIRSLGDAEYGVYRVIQAFAGQLSIMTLGMATLVTRNIVFFDTQKQQKEKENFLAMGLIISIVMAVVALILGVFIYAGAGQIFQKSLSLQEIETAKRLIFFFICNVALTILDDFFLGLLSGHEKFAVSNIAKTIRLLLRVITLVITLKLGFKSVAIVITDLCLTLLMLLFHVAYGIFHLKENIKFHYWDKNLFRSSMWFSVAILLQAIINQVNQNVDSVILGVMTNAKTVALYSVGLVIFTTYNGVSSVMASVFTPTATRLCLSGADGNELTNFVSRVGRYQLILVGAVLSGFILFGKEFICIWLNEEYLPVYEIVLWLIVPTTVPLIQNAYQAVLDAKLKRMARSVILSIAAVLNVVISVLLIPKVGYIGAAYGTAASIVIGHVICMNLYLKKSMGFKVVKMFKDTCHKILPCVVAATILSIPLKRIMIFDSPLISLLFKLFIFMGIYFSIMYFFGMNSGEKIVIKNIVKKMLFRKKRCKHVQK